MYCNVLHCTALHCIALRCALFVSYLPYFLHLASCFLLARVFIVSCLLGRLRFLPYRH